MPLAPGAAVSAAPSIATTVAALVALAQAPAGNIAGLDIAALQSAVDSGTNDAFAQVLATITQDIASSTPFVASTGPQIGQVPGGSDLSTAHNRWAITRIVFKWVS